MRKEIMEEYNEWWYTDAVPRDLLLPYRRPLFYDIKKSLAKRFILSIVGLRRTGKTTILFQLIDSLLQKDVKSRDILYFSFDETVEGIKDVIDTYRDIQNKDLRKGRTYLFLDEVQKLKGWENQIKQAYDLYPKLKLVISGSESLFVGRLSKETLAGRIHEFHLPTLSFREFVDFKGIDPKPYAPRIRPAFLEYVNKGGFPEIINETNPKEAKRYIRSSVIDKIVRQDIPQLSGIRNIELLYQILELVAINPGMDLNYQNLAQRFDGDRRTVKEYVAWLSDSFLIRLLGNYRRGSASLRKNKRAYLSDTGMISVFKPVIDETFFGRMVECAVINSLHVGAFWKNRQDVDAVVNGVPLEVKYQEKIAKSDLKGLSEFMKRFNVKSGFLITKNTEKTVKTEHGEVILITAWKLLLSPEMISTNGTGVRL